MQESYSDKGGQVFTTTGGSARFIFLSSSSRPIIAHLYYLSPFLSFLITSTFNYLHSFIHNDNDNMATTVPANADLMAIVVIGVSPFSLSR